MTKKLFFAIICCLSLAAVAGAENGPVKIWEGTIDLPTYQTLHRRKLRCSHATLLIREQKDGSTLIR